MRRRRWLILVFVAVLFVALLMLGGYWAFVFYVALAVLGVAWLMTYPAPGRLRVERYVSLREAEVGQTAEVRVRITNAGPLPVAWVLAEDMCTPEMTATGVHGELTWLAPGGETVMTYNVFPARRGYYRLGPVLLETGDYFGLLRRFMARPPVAYLTVYPRLLPVGRMLVPTSRPLGEARVARYVIEDPSRPAGVREYRRGDPLRRIHWKATAHTGRLHSRVYEFTRLQGANLVLDFGQGSWPPPARDGSDAGELAVSVAASIAAHMRERGQHFGLVSNGLDAARLIEAWPQELDVAGRERAIELLEVRQAPERFEPVVVPAGRGEETLELVLGALARLAPGTGLTLPELIAREHPAWSRELAAVLVVPEVTRELMEAVGVLRGARFSVTMILVGGGAPRGLVGALTDEGVGVYGISSAEEVASLAL